MHQPDLCKSTHHILTKYERENTFMFIDKLADEDLLQSMPCE
jgi:hypothetical protein